MRFLRKSLSGLFLLALTFGLAFFAYDMVSTSIKNRGEDGGGRPGGGGGRERVFAVNVVQFTPDTQTPVLSVFGEVASTRVLDLRPATGGTVKSLHPNFQSGGRVMAGDLLVEIDAADAETAFAFAQADLAEAEAEARDAARALDLANEELVGAEDQADLRQKALQRQQDLITRGVGAAANLEAAELAAATARQGILTRRQAIAQAESRVDLARARVDRRNIALTEAQRNVDDTQMFAAFDGVLTDVTLVAGGTVTANERIGQIVDPDALEVAFRVSTPQHARLLQDNGQLRTTAATVTLDVFGATIEHQARLTREAPVVGEGQTGRLLFATLDNSDGLRPGDFVQVDVAEPPLNRIARLPATALGANDSVLVVGEDDRLREEPVNLIRRQGEDILVRARGLQGQNIVTARSPLLGAGIKVRMLTDDGSTEPEAPKTVALTDERRTALIAFVEANNRMPKAVKERMLQQLSEPEVPVQMVERLEGRMGN